MARDAIWGALEVTEVERWLLCVLKGVLAQRPADFAGLGLLFYTAPLPAKTLEESIELFADIARRNSVCHDGFHLVQAKTRFVTDVSQFLSPPIRPLPLAIERVSGARHMAARLASFLPAVALAAICTSESEALLYERGQLRTIRIA